MFWFNFITLLGLALAFSWRGA